MLLNGPNYSPAPLAPAIPGLTERPYDAQQVVARDRSLVLLIALLAALLVAGVTGCGGRSDGATSQRVVSVTVDASDSHACALLSSGDVYCWGDNESGELGTRLPRGQRQSQKPIRVKHVPKALSVAVGSGYDSGFTCAALRGGKVSCWGSNAMGTLGRGRFPKHGFFPSGFAGFHPDPTTIRGVERVIAVSGTYDHVCALLSSGRVVCWGGNEYEQLGDGRSDHGTFALGASDWAMDFSPRPVAVKGIRTATQVSAGVGQTCTILKSGRVSCWGVINGVWVGADKKPPVSIDSPKPIEVKGVHNARQISVGSGFACAVIAGGSIECWSSTVKAQVGSPITVRGVAGATQVSAGQDRACAVTRGGLVECWDEGYSRIAKTPGRAEQVKGLSKIVQVSVGSEDRCALRSDGKVFCWKTSPFWPEGLGSTAGRTPTEVTGFP